MKKLLVLLIIISMLTACSIPFAYPEGGQFYCDELQMMLDFSSENNEAIFEENGKEITGHFMTDFGARVYVEYTEYINGERIVHRVLAGKFRYRFGKVMVRTDDGEEYIFLPKAEVGLSTGVRGTALLPPKKNHINPKPNQHLPRRESHLRLLFCWRFIDTRSGEEYT